MTDLEYRSDSVAPVLDDRSRSLLSRLRLGHVVMVVAALFALVLNLAILSGSDDTAEIVVAAGDIAAGTRLTNDHLATAAVAADDLTTSRFILAVETSNTAGMMTTRPIPAGAPLLASDLLSVENRTGLRAMSIPIDQTRAVSGHIERGDLVDIVLVVDGTATYVATAVEVLDVPAADLNALGARSGYAPTIAVDATQALRIAAALDSGEVHIVRSTGAGLPDLTEAAAIADQPQDTSE